MFDTKATLSKDALFALNSVTPTVGADSVVSSIVDSADVNAGAASQADDVDVTVETVLASLVDTVVDTVAPGDSGVGDTCDSVNANAVSGTICKKPRQPFVIPSEPTLLLCPTVRVECLLCLLLCVFFCVCL